MPQQNEPNLCNMPGYKNIMCPFYDYCLDFAVDRKWLHFCCHFCIHRSAIRPSNTEDMDLGLPSWEEIWGGVYITEDLS